MAGCRWAGALDQPAADQMTRRFAPRSDGKQVFFVNCSPVMSDVVDKL